MFEARLCVCSQLQLYDKEERGLTGEASRSLHRSLCLSLIQFNLNWHENTSMKHEGTYPLLSVLYLSVCKHSVHQCLDSAV